LEDDNLNPISFCIVYIFCISGNTKLQHVMEENCKLKSLVESSMENVKTLQEKYEKEMSSRADDHTKLHELKTELEGVQNALKNEVDAKTEGMGILCDIILIIMYPITSMGNAE